MVTLVDRNMPVHATNSGESVTEQQAGLIAGDLKNEPPNIIAPESSSEGNTES
jgi:hypothetical protein